MAGNGNGFILGNEGNVMLASRKTPWELGLSWANGQKPGEYQEFTSAADMLEAAGMAGWDVRKVQLYAGRKGAAVQGRYGTVTSTGEVLGVVGPAYRIIQNEELFQFGDQLVQDDAAKWERAGGFYGGKWVFGCMELSHLNISVPGDDSDVKPYLLLVNSFDGSLSMRGILAYIRPVCINTFQMAVGTKTKHQFALRHVGTDITARLEQAREALGIAIKHNTEAAAVINMLATKAIVDEQVREIFAKAVWPISENATEGARENSLATKAYELYQTSETLDTVRGTAWGAFNAVTEFVDHYSTYRTRDKSGVNTDDDIKGASILLGNAELRKEKALKALIALK